MVKNLSSQDYIDLMRQRISALLETQKMSEYELSYALGRNKGYINKITRGISTPSMTQFLNMCEIFETEPSYFFSQQMNHPAQISRLIPKLYQLKKEDLNLIMAMTDRLSESCKG